MSGAVEQDERERAHGLRCPTCGVARLAAAEESGRLLCVACGTRLALGISWRSWLLTWAAVGAVAGAATFLVFRFAFGLEGAGAWAGFAGGFTGAFATILARRRRTLRPVR
ncbi:MAG: hypothetical protein ABW221_11930 [Vicinamibacteria bacterium]